MKLLARTLAAAAIVFAAAPASAAEPVRAFAPDADPAASAIWQKVRTSLFGTREITPAGADVLELLAPSRAVDAGVVPVAVYSRLPQGATGHVATIYLIVDANPSPISAIVRFTPDSGRAQFETRLRVDQYSHLRAVAETDDGRLFMATRFIKASGGCSAAPGSDAAAALATLGQMRLRVSGDAAAGQPVLAQLQISHPNHTGLAMDQLTRQVTPAHFLRQLEVRHAGRLVFAADLDFSISENPWFRFAFLPRGDTRLEVEASDTQGQRFAGVLTPVRE
ncbi:quinoprotein dehydrogenase-associated SoxYZ-like carrier [Rubrivivax gelatinosus]|nr:quinoprotein dehydrogenase-associated SoxYZ-like carrier [Rubrivivax gelatinosus]